MSMDDNKTFSEEVIKELEDKIRFMQKRAEHLEAQIEQMESDLENKRLHKKANLSNKKSKKVTSSKNKSSKKNDDKLPEEPYGTKISGIMKEGIEFYWKKLERADGYEIFRYYDPSDEPEKITEIKHRAIGTYIDSDFDHSKRSVFYSVRSYRIQNDGTKKFSGISVPREACYRETLTLEREETYLYSGDSRGIRAFYGWGEPEDVKWISDNKNVATIDSGGMIKAVSSGSCKIKCICDSIKQSAEAEVVVDRKACEPLSPITSRYSFDRKTKCWENPVAPKSNNAVIMLAGDMMCGKKQMNTQYSDKEGWNFNDSYRFIKDITASADLSVANLETLLAAGWPYMSDETYINNYNNCNAPSRYLDAVKYGGFDTVIMANNHSCDGGLKALNETIEQVDKYKLARTGVFKNASEDRFVIHNINGIRVGFVAYISSATGFNHKDETWAAADKATHLNIFTADKACEDIAKCKKAGAEYVIAYMHWGFKNHRTIATHQFAEAKAVADAGADYIVGSNPHLLQRYESVVTDDGRKVPCAYSVGNFQSVMNQVPGNRDSIILRIRLIKDNDGKVKLAENNYIPCFTYTDLLGCHWATVSVGNTFNRSIKMKNRKKFHDRIVQTIGNEIDEF